MQQGILLPVFSGAMMVVLMVFLLRENAMWTCRHCGMTIPIGAVDPQKDSEGYYFACPGCEGRNRLTDTLEDDEEGGGGLAQPDI
jgi:hypothetical protein